MKRLESCGKAVDARPPEVPTGDHDGRCALDLGAVRALHLGTTSSPVSGPSRAHPRQSSPSTGLPAYPRQNSHNAPQNPKFGPFLVRRANFLALVPTSGRTRRTISRAGRGNVATLKPVTPLHPLMEAGMKPPSPMLAPEQQPLKPVAPLQPKNALNTPISHPQRRRRFQVRLRPSKQRRRRFHARDFRCKRTMASPEQHTFACNSATDTSDFRM